MVDAGLNPQGPARYWIAYALAREQEQQDSDQSQQGGHGQDIQVIE